MPSPRRRVVCALRGVCWSTLSFLGRDLHRTAACAAVMSTTPVLEREPRPAPSLFPHLRVVRKIGAHSSSPGCRPRSPSWPAPEGTHDRWSPALPGSDDAMPAPCWRDTGRSNRFMAQMPGFAGDRCLRFVDTLHRFEVDPLLIIDREAAYVIFVDLVFAQLLRTRPRDHTHFASPSRLHSRRRLRVRRHQRGRAHFAVDLDATRSTGPSTERRSSNRRPRSSARYPRTPEHRVRNEALVRSKDASRIRVIGVS